MADYLRQAERAHHASKYSALGNGCAEPLTAIHIGKILKSSSEEEVLTDVSKWAFDLTLILPTNRGHSDLSNG
jgi:hypothetical protein